MRHGLGQLASSLGLARWLSLGARWGGRSSAAASDWEDRVPWVLADLGATFIKLGQVASTRTDLLSPRLVAALERLQDQVPPIPLADVHTVLERAWGTDPLAVLWLDPTVMASASLAQVHGGRLPDGRAVVVKVRRPGLLATAQVDCEIVAQLAAAAEARIPAARQYGLAGLVGELVQAFLAELDFTREANNTQEAARRAPADGTVRIPEVVWELTRPDVLVMTRLNGVKVSDPAELAAAGQDPHEVARRLVHTLYREIFVDGFFHADPHPGNVHVDQDGQLILLDWGMVGRLSPAMREHSADLLLGMARGHSAQVVRALLQLGVVEGAINRAALAQDVDRLRRRYYESSLAEFELGQALTDVLALAARHRVRIPHEYALLAKAAVTLDGLVRRLDPSASLVDLGRPLMAQLLAARFGPRAVAAHLEDNLLQWLSVADALPYSLERLMERIDEGCLKIELEPTNLERLMKHWEKLVNRLALSLLASALVVGTALVTHRSRLDRLVGMPVGEYAFLVSLAVATGVIVLSVRRQG